MNLIDLLNGKKAMTISQLLVLEQEEEKRVEELYKIMHELDESFAKHNKAIERKRRIYLIIYWLVIVLLVVRFII